MRNFERLRVGVGHSNAINSTPSTPAAIMRFTALLPPPPTPITLMRALRCVFIVVVDPKGLVRLIRHREFTSGERRSPLSILHGQSMRRLCEIHTRTYVDYLP